MISEFALTRRLCHAASPFELSPCTEISWLLFEDLNGSSEIIHDLSVETYTGDVQVFRALKAGAHGYLLKNLLYLELLETIRAIHAGEKALSPEASYEIAQHATDEVEFKKQNLHL